MQYNSLLFLFTFLPLFLMAYYLVPDRWKNLVLLLSSVLYYTVAVSSSVWALALLLVIIAVTYLTGRMMVQRAMKWLFWAVFGILLACLVFFKCFAGGRYLPVGMSFYLFQIAAYLMRIYRGQMTPETSLLSYGTQILMFPKLLSGPLTDPAALAQQTITRQHDLETFRQGLQELIAGLALKVLIANRIGGLWAQAAVVGYESISPVFAWMSLIAYAMKLYFDFYGYSVMACGIGKMIGFSLPRNFDSPYASKTVSEFYRRWHITLGLWFREHIYIPLGGNRGGKLKTILNLAVVWLATGLWHGIGGNFLLWAGILLLFIVLERLWIGAWLKKSCAVGYIYTVLVILISWVPFAIGDASQMLSFLGRLFGIGGRTVNALDFVYWLKKYALLLISGVIFATPYPKMLWDKVRKHWLTDAALFVLFWCCVYFIATSAQDPFAYFQF